MQTSAFRSGAVGPRSGPTRSRDLFAKLIRISIEISFTDSSAAGYASGGSSSAHDGPITPPASSSGNDRPRTSADCSGVAREPGGLGRPGHGQRIGVGPDRGASSDRDGAGPPVFFIHPGVGLSWCYAGFARHLRGLPIYGLHARAVSDTNLLVPTLTDMALDYIEQIREACPGGPYRLEGWSFGGNVAHTIAASASGSLGRLTTSPQFRECEVSVLRNRGGSVLTAPCGLS